MVFILFFAILFYSTSKAFKKNRPVAVAIAIALTLLIVGALVQRGFFDSYYGDVIGDWALALAALLVFAFIVKLLYNSFGKKTVIVILFITWLILTFMDPYSILPPTMPDFVFIIYDFASGFSGFIILVIASLVLLAFKNKRMRNALSTDLGNIIVAQPRP